jgi:hypothetical protein
MRRPTSGRGCRRVFLTRDQLGHIVYGKRSERYAACPCHALDLDQSPDTLLAEVLGLAAADEASTR